MSDEPHIPPPGVRLAPGVYVPEGALTFSYAASSGPGGQNVNKRATKAQLRVHVAGLGLSHEREARLRALAGSLLTDADELLITASEHRSQSQNRDACLERLADLVRHALVRPKVRRATKPTRGSKERRLETKHRRADLKRRRRDSEH